MQNDYLLFNALVDSGKWARITGAAVRFLGVLMRHGDAQWRCFLRNDTAAREAGVCAGHFYRVRAELERLGVLTWSTDGRKTFYQLHVPGSVKAHTTTSKLSAAHKTAQKREQIVRRRISSPPRSIDHLTDSSSIAPPALPADAAAMLDKLKKTGVRPAKAAEWCAKWPLGVLSWALARCSKRKPHNPTGFIKQLLDDEGSERAAAIAAENAEREHRKRLIEQDEAQNRKKEDATNDIERMLRHAWDTMTPAQRVGLHLRAASSAPLKRTAEKLRSWTAGEPMAVALALLRDELAGRKS